MPKLGKNMRARPPRIFGLILVIGCGLGAAWCSGGTPSRRPPIPQRRPHLLRSPPRRRIVEKFPSTRRRLRPRPTPPPAGIDLDQRARRHRVVRIAGDGALARLMENLGGDILFAGDLAYDRGTIEEFRRCFDPAYARFRSRFWAVPGNHEYMTAGAAGYFTYFAERAGPDQHRLLRVAHRGWQVLMLNSKRADEARLTPASSSSGSSSQSSRGCTLAVWHHPFDSSGPNGPNTMAARLWELLYNRQRRRRRVRARSPVRTARADERESDNRIPARGVRLFISGGGGAPPYQRARARAPFGAPHLNARTAAPQARARSLRVGVPRRERQRSRPRPEHLSLTRRFLKFRCS